MSYNSIDIASQKQDVTWEDGFESIPGVSRVTEDDLPYLQQILKGCEDVDSYVTSSIYYIFTGRKGLWIYQKDNTFMFVCWHPNVADQILVFPQLINQYNDLLPKLLAAMPMPRGGMRIARVKKDGPQAKTYANQNHYLALNVCEENILDWKFPVHILSTEAVASLAGKNFMYIRNRLHQLRNHSVTVAPCDATHHSKALENLLHRWASHYATSAEEYEDLYSPYENLFSLSMQKTSGLLGQMFFVDDVLQAVSLWDISNVSHKTANLFVNISNTEIRGLSEFLIVNSCKNLHENGIAFLNLGGSETSGLDFYKHKFRPVKSIDLRSVDITIENMRKMATASIVKAS